MIRKPQVAVTGCSMDEQLGDYAENDLSIASYPKKKDDCVVISRLLRFTEKATVEE